MDECACVVSVSDVLCNSKKTLRWSEFSQFNGVVLSVGDFVKIIRMYRSVFEDTAKIKIYTRAFIQVPVRSEIPSTTGNSRHPSALVAIGCDLSLTFTYHS
jgi:hypothetical protein